MPFICNLCLKPPEKNFHFIVRARNQRIKSNIDNWLMDISIGLLVMRHIAIDSSFSLSCIFFGQNADGTNVDGSQLHNGKLLFLLGVHAQKLCA